MGAYREMLERQAERYNTTIEVIAQAHDLFAEPDPETEAELLASGDGYGFSLKDCILYVKARN